MVILKDRFIIVDECQLGLGVDQELVGHPGVVHVVDAAGQDGGQDLVRGEDFIQSGAAEEDVSGLGHISSVEMVVIRNILNINSQQNENIYRIRNHTIISLT